jgi:hypothetical protein
MEENGLVQFDNGDLIYLDQIDEKLSQLCRWYQNLDPERKRDFQNFLKKSPYSDADLLWKEVTKLDRAFGYFLYLVSVYLAKLPKQKVEDFLKKKGISEGEISDFIRLGFVYPNPVRDGRMVKGLSNRKFRNMVEMIIKRVNIGKEQDQIVQKDLIKQFSIQPEVANRVTSFIFNLTNIYVERTVDSVYIYKLFESCGLQRRKASIYLKALEENGRDLFETFCLEHMDLIWNHISDFHRRIGRIERNFDSRPREMS